MPENRIGRFAAFVGLLWVSIAAGPTSAQTLSPAEEAARDEALEKEEAKSRLAIYGWIETSFTGNPAGPTDHQNFGRLFDDGATRS